MNYIERRFISHRLELRCDCNSNRSTIRGYASIFNSPSSPGALPFREIVRPGAFSRAIKEGQDVLCLVNHDQNQIVGRTKAGSLRLREDDKGLFIENDCPDTQVGRDLVTNIRAGLIRQMSFSFIPKRQRFYKEQGMNCRDLEDVDILDVSPCPFGVYSDTVVGAEDNSKHFEDEGSGWDDLSDDDEDDDRKLLLNAAIRAQFPQGVQPEMRAYFAQPYRKDPDRAMRKRRERLHRALSL
jgi:Escherichia/Staphylococcus phage prohead protease